MKPKVAVGICVRNCEDYIGDTINSILEQDIANGSMSLIFVDDGSVDCTSSLIEERLSKVDIPLEIIRTSWKGIGHARNVVLSKANSEYVLWVDGDMILAKDFVRKLVDFMEKNTDVAIAKGKQSLEFGAGLLSSLEASSRAAGRMIDYNSEKAKFTALGTGGSIYRVKAIKQVGGFDANLKRYGEDWDLEIRVRNAGWSLSTVDVIFSDYERFGLTWKNLWIKYWLRGYYSHYFLHKNGRLIKLHRMFPFAAFIGGIIQSRKLYRLTKQHFVFLLPFEHFFKTSAWYLGYIKSHLNSFEP